MAEAAQALPAQMTDQSLVHEGQDIIPGAGVDEPVKDLENTFELRLAVPQRPPGHLQGGYIEQGCDTAARTGNDIDAKKDIFPHPRPVDQQKLILDRRFLAACPSAGMIPHHHLRLVRVGGERRPLHPAFDLLFGIAGHLLKAAVGKGDGHILFDDHRK